MLKLVIKTIYREDTFNTINRVWNDSELFYNIYTKEILLSFIIVYSILFFIISFIIYKKVKDKRIWFLNAILLYFRVFLLIGILKYVK